MKYRFRFFFSELFFRSSWVTIFLLLCLIAYENNKKNFIYEYNQLKSKYKQLEKEKLEVHQARKELLLRMNSQSDPAWLEIVLIKSLGLVPEGQKKMILLNKRVVPKTPEKSD